MFAKKLGVKFALGTDAHQLDQLWTMELGVDVAKRAWLEGNDIINYLSFDKLMKWLKK
jgi:DNA polymerase (family 10)